MRPVQSTHAHLFCVVMSAPHILPHFPRCRPRQDTGPSWSCSSFGDYTPFASACPGFNDYKLGLNNLNASSPYFTRLAGSPAAMSAAYLAKNILYVLGEADVCNCLSSGVTNPAVCFRASQTCSPVANGNNASCCDMPAPQPINAMVDIACGDMLQVGGSCVDAGQDCELMRVFCSAPVPDTAEACRCSNSSSRSTSRDTCSLCMMCEGSVSGGTLLAQRERTQQRKQKVLVH